MTSPTANKGMIYPAHGGAVNSWDTPLNGNFEQLDLNLGGRYPITISSTIAGATYGSTGATLSSTVATATIPSSLAQNIFYDLSGTLASALSIVYPAVGSLYLINNVTSGSFAVSATVSSTSATPVTIPQGGATFIMTSSQNIITDSNKVSAPVLRSQMQQLTNNTLMGNVSGSSTTPQEITFGNGLTPYSTSSKIDAPGFAPPSAYKNLVIKVATSTTVTVSADFVAMTNGTNFITLPISATCDLGSNGAVNKLDAGSIAAATFYAIFAIYNPTTGVAGTLASFSATAPTLPAGFTFFARIGWVLTSSSVAQLMGTWQFGRDVAFVVGLAQTTQLPVIASSTTAGLGTVNIAGTMTYVATTVVGAGFFAPTTASVIKLMINNQYKNAGVTNIGVASNASYGGANTGPFGSVGMTPQIWGSALVGLPVQGQILLESTSIYIAAQTAGWAVFANGWIDNI